MAGRASNCTRARPAARGEDAEADKTCRRDRCEDHTMILTPVVSLLAPLEGELEVTTLRDGWGGAGDVGLNLRSFLRISQDLKA